ncbi:MAG TPA: hypothetical protein EYH43_01510 [Persephonella sp.]|nr:hypothetical protein [Hydrogenothermaceae bacterium]HIQ24646.1 hypothetical protein [Persephonella sp.]
MKIKNWPLVIITGFGIIAIFLITFIFIQGLAINTVREALIMEKAYPKIKPQEYVNELKRIASKNNIEIKLLFKGNNSYLLQITRKKLSEKLLNETPNVAVLSVVNVSIYDVGDGTGLVATNPYIWDIIAPNSYIDDIAQGFGEELSMIFDSIYWDYRKKQKMLKE